MLMGRFRMSGSLPPLNWLRAFEAAARHMSFTEAARELGVTQSAVSQQVRLLEGRLGQPLFRRLARSLELTEAGRAYLPKVHQAFETLGHATEEIFGTRDDRPLTVRATLGFAALWLVPRLGRFREANPSVAINLVTSLWHDARGSEGIDLEIRYGTTTKSDFTAEQLTEEWHFPVCAPAIAAGLASPGDLAGHTLLHTVGFETGWPQWLKAAGVASEPSAAGRVSCDTSVLALDLARRGAGVALARTTYAEEALARGDLVAPFDLRIPAEGFHLLTPRRRALPPHAKAFRDWLLSEIAVPRR